MAKKFYVIFSGAAVVLSTIAAPVVLAQSRGAAATGSAGFCSALAEKVSNVEQRISDQISKLDDAESTREINLSDRWDKFTSNRDTARAAQDDNLDARMTKLDSAAGTDAARQAVADFELAVKDALNAKREAVDAAIDAFHEGTVSLLETRKTAVMKVFTDREDAFGAATVKAEGDCDAGISPVTVRTALVAALKDARAKFAAARKANSDFSAKMQQLVAAKKAALDKAQSDFRTALEKAKTALKTVLGEPEASSTSQ